jgi:hypothetical protein
MSYTFPKAKIPPKPPKGGSAVQCGHDYAFLYSDYEMTEGPGLSNYRQYDTFYCKKCLEYKTKLARTADERGRPSWYKR